MATQIAVLIATNQQIYDYMGITATEAAAFIVNGTTTLASYLSRCAFIAGDQIVKWIGHDYTATQVIQERFFGNDGTHIRIENPAGGITTFKSWDPANPATAPVDIGAPQLAAVSIDPYVLYRTDGKTFDCNLEYYIEFEQIADPLVYNGWPYGLVQVQLEMIAHMYKESMNSAGTVDIMQDGSSEFHVTKFKDMDSLFLHRVRPYRRFAA